MKKYIIVILAAAFAVMVSCKGETGPAGSTGASTIISVFQQGVLPNVEYAGATDAIISSGIPAGNFGGCAEIGAGYISSISLSAVRGLMKFDVSSIAPANVTVTRAYVKFYVYNTWGTSVTVTAHAVDSAWTEGTGSCAGNVVTDVTWNSTGSAAWTAAGADFGATAASNSIMVTPAMEGSFINLNLNTSMVQSWISDPSTNNGFILVGDNESSDSAVTFSSSERVSTSTRPALVIEYTLP